MSVLYLAALFPMAIPMALGLLLDRLFGEPPRFHPLVGFGRYAAAVERLFRRLGAQVVYRMALINGEPGLLRYVDGRIESAQAFVTDGERIVAIYAVRNPDKLAGIPATLPL